MLNAKWTWRRGKCAEYLVNEKNSQVWSRYTNGIKTFHYDGSKKIESNLILLNRTQNVHFIISDNKIYFRPGIIEDLESLQNGMDGKWEIRPVKDQPGNFFLI